VSSQIVPLKTKQQNVQDLIERYREKIADALPRQIRPSVMMRAIFNAVQKTPGILDCDPRSLISAVLETSQLGLAPGILGEAYLVPFRNTKMGKREVQLIVGYRGLVTLARRSGELSTIYAKEVYDRDEFDYCFGLEPRLKHKPSDLPEKERGPLRYVYAVARLKDGGVQFDIMTRADVEKIRGRSKAKDSGPWITDYEEMCKKTILRRLCKLLPSSVELQEAMAKEELPQADIAREFGIVDLPGDDAPALPPTDDENPASKLDQVVADRKIKARPKENSQTIGGNYDYAEGSDPDPMLDRAPGQDG